MRKVIIFGLLAMMVGTAAAKNVGIFMDKKTGNIAGISNALVRAGWNITYFNGSPVNKGKGTNWRNSKKDIEDETLLNQMDVLLFLGGFNRYFFPINSKNARKAIVRAAARGTGVLLAGFRSGYVRSANRPMFPEIGYTHNRVNSPWMTVEPNTPFTDAFGGKPIAFAGHDHIVFKQGEKGKVFCRCEDDITGCYGDFYYGKVITFGGHFGYNTTDPGADEIERVFMAMVNWLDRNHYKAASEKDQLAAADKAEMDFIRREVTLTWTLDERGPDRYPGQLPVIRDDTTSPADSLRYKLDYYAKFLSASDAKRCRGTSAALAAATDKVKAKAERDNEYLAKQLAEMDLERLEKVFNEKEKIFDLERKKKEYAALIPSKLIAEANALIEEFKPKVRATKVLAIEAENEADMKLVPGLIKALKDPCAKKRFEAALELGRIAPDDGAAVDALISAMDDKDQEVRTQAVITLGWLRATKAVEPLIARIKDAQKYSEPDRRRAIEALGIIGDQSAIPAVLEAYEKASSRELKLLSIMSLGWLKAKNAVPMLLKLAKDEKTPVMAWREAAVQALGYIGDKSAVEELKKFMATDTRPRAGRKEIIDNPYSYRSARGLYLHARSALKYIEQGGRKTLGVVQDPDTRSRENFYALTKRNNAFAGRTLTGRRGKLGNAAGQKILLPFLVDAGFTGVHNGWGWGEMNPDDYESIMEEAEDLGLIWIDTLPSDNAVRCLPQACELALDRFNDVLSFKGFWYEETWPEPAASPDSFKAFLKSRYGADYEKTLGLTDAEIAAVNSSQTAALKPMKDGSFTTNITSKLWGPWCDTAASKWLDDGKDGIISFEPPYDGVLHTLSAEVSAVKLEEEWRETQDFLHARRRGCGNTYVISQADPVKHIGGNAALKRMDAIGPESYSSFGRGNAFMMEKYRDGEARPALAEFYNWYCPSNEHALRGFWQNAIHGKCFFNFALHQIFEQPTYDYLWTWEKGRWAKAKEVFTRVRSNEEYYAICPSAANVAVMGSERSAAGVKEQIYYQVSFLIRTDENLLSIWTALNEAHIPADIIYAEGIDDKKLRKYDVIYLANAKMLTDAEGEVLREWVKAGGILIAEGTTSLFDPHRPKNVLKNYRLADLFGVDWKESVFRQGEEADTFAWRPRAPTSYPVRPGLEDIVHFEDYIHRDVKPKKSVIKAQTAEGLKFEYDAALGYDKVEPKTAKVLATLENGDPAVFVNEFGKGRCYFQTMHYPMLGVTTLQWEMLPNKFIYWPGVREHLEGLVRGGFAAKGVSEPITLTGATAEVEMTVDDQVSRYVIHLLDYDVESKSVKGASVKINGTRPIKRVFYPNTQTDLEVAADRTVKLRDFSVYDMVVVEFAK